MKTTLVLAGTLLLVAGCGTTQTDSRQARGYPASKTTSSVYSDQRIEGEWAREAGMAERDWTVGRREWLPPIAAPTPVQSTDYAQGGAAEVGEAVSVTTGSSGLEIADQAQIDLRKEELVVGKREVSNGGVLIRTVVQSEEVKQPVELRREEYVIERIPAGSALDQQARTEGAFQGREIYLPLMREEPITSKRTLLTEGVKVAKRIETDNKTVSMPVRSEDIEVVKNPNLSDPRFASVPRRNTVATVTPREVTAPASQSAEMLKLAKEEMIVSKQEVDNGGVYLQKVIRTETASQPIDLRREEYSVERVALSGEAPTTDFSPRQIQMNLNREEPVAGTRTLLTETIKVRKQMQTDKQIVSGTVRKEAVEVVRLTEGTVGVGGTSAAGQSGVTTISETSGTPQTKDQILSDHVKTVLAKTDSSCCDYSRIDITAADGVVTLRGDVPTSADKKAVEKQVKKMSGVRSVKNELHVLKP